MKTLTFITGFIISSATFSPLALGKHVDFPKMAEFGKHCELRNLPDHAVATVQQGQAPRATQQRVHSANYSVEQNYN